MPFAYYNRLRPRQKEIYRASDAVPRIELPRPQAATDALRRVRTTLAADDRRALNRACQDLVDEIDEQLGVPPVDVRVLAARPSKSWGELQGLYETGAQLERARITVWMRTAQRRQIVAFKTFLRTLLHELGHHLDYEFLELADSFHTEGFFQRESSLFHQLTAAAGGESAQEA